MLQNTHVDVEAAIRSRSCWPSARLYHSVTEHVFIQSASPEHENVLAVSEQPCYRAGYAACAPVAGTSQSETQHVLTASKKPLQRACSESVVNSFFIFDHAQCSLDSFARSARRQALALSVVA